MNAPDLETLLRSAPQPRPPAGLAENLMKNLPAHPTAADSASPARQSAADTRSHSSGTTPRHVPWWLLLLGTGLVAGAAVTTWQAAEIRALQTQLTDVSNLATAAAPNSAPPQSVPATSVGAGSNPASNLEDPRAEIERLKAEINRLRESFPRIVSSTTDTPPVPAPETGALTADEIAFLDETRARSQAIVCVNNLKQIGLAVRIYALDNEKQFPPDLDAARSYIGSPKPLHCPADTTRPTPQDWSDYTSANLSYEYLAPDGSESDPRRVLSRCPVHGTVGLCDGSAFMNTPDKPLKIVNRGGKLYLE